MLTTTRDGVKVAYEERGAGSPAFVFVHGWTCNRSFFAPQADAFAKRHRVVSVDLRGHGESDTPQGAYPISAYADDIAQLIGELKLGKVIAVGHSMGGVTVLQLAVAHPDRVAGIVMVDPAPFTFPPELRAAIEGLVAAIEAGNRGPQRQFIEEHLFLPTSDKALVKRVVDVDTDRVRALRLVTLTVSTQVDRHDAMPFREGVSLWREERAITRPAMDEDERG